MLPAIFFYIYIGPGIVKGQVEFQSSRIYLRISHDILTALFSDQTPQLVPSPNFVGNVGIQRADCIVLYDEIPVTVRNGIFPPCRVMFEIKSEDKEATLHKTIQQLLDFPSCMADMLNTNRKTIVVLLTPGKFYMGIFDTSVRREKNYILMKFYNIFCGKDFYPYEWIRFLYDFGQLI